MELIDDSPDPEKSLLWALKNNRPQSTEKTAKADKKSKEVAHQKRVAAKKKKRKKCRKSVRLQELRDLIDYFREKAKRFYEIDASHDPPEVVFRKIEGLIRKQ